MNHFDVGDGDGDDYDYDGEYLLLYQIFDIVVDNLKSHRDIQSYFVTYVIGTNHDKQRYLYNVVDVVDDDVDDVDDVDDADDADDDVFDAEH